MKKLLFSFLCALSLPLFAQNATTDHFEVSDVTIATGQFDYETYYFTVNLVGSRIYTAYNLCIKLPDGIVVYENGGHLGVDVALEDGLYPFTSSGRPATKTYKHTLACTFIDNTIRIACSSNENANFLLQSGKAFYVTIKASAFAKPGVNTISLSQQALVMSDGTKYVPADVEYSNITVTPAQVSLPLNISSTHKWSTCVLPFDAAIPTGVTVYAAGQISDGKLHLSPVNAFSAYTPYLVYAENGFSGTVSGTPSESAYNSKVTNGVADATAVLRGAIATQSLTSGYVLQNQGSGAKFYNINDATFVINPGKCWLVIPAGQQAPAIDLTTEELTAIEDVECTDDANAPIYNIQGMQVSEMIPGHIYIQNGKKFIKL